MSLNKIIIFLLLFSAVAIVMTVGVIGKTKPYYVGDAIAYNNEVIIGSANMDKLEFFKVEKNKLTKTSEVVSSRYEYSGFDSFYSLKFNIENGSLFAYTVDGQYLYKYDVSDLKNPVLKSQVKDNAYNWDWLMGVEKSGDMIATVSKKGIKIWNSSPDIIDSYSLPKTKDFYNVSFSQDGRYIYNLEDDSLSIFDTEIRSVISTVALETTENHNRKVYAESNLVYVADDESLKKINTEGEILGEFKFTANVGYDVVGSSDSKYIYFSDGIGVVKLAKDNMKAVDWAYTTGLGGEEGWAMGLKAVTAGNKEYVVLFNNANVLVLDSSLDKVGSYQSSSEETKPEVKESLYLSLDRTRAAGNSSISLLGGGFGANESLEITFGDISGAKTTTTADADGKLSKILVVPDVETQKLDIKVVGETTGLNYSIAFLIE